MTGRRGEALRSPVLGATTAVFALIAVLAQAGVTTSAGAAGRTSDRQASRGVTSRVSMSSSGAQSDGLSRLPSLSADGRYVAFSSFGSNLVPGDTNTVEDAFIRDRQTGTTLRVSVSSTGAQGNDFSFEPHLSGDGRYVGFASLASNLVRGDTNQAVDVFVRDLQTGTTRRVSVSSSGAQADSFSREVSLSADGRYVAFTSNASNLVPGPSNIFSDVYVRDLTSGTTRRISVGPTGTEGNRDSYRPSLSASGRFVTFVSQADNLAPGKTTHTDDVFVRDLSTGITRFVSKNSNGVGGNFYSNDASVSSDGRYVVFRSVATNLVPHDTNRADDILVWDRERRAMERVSLATDGSPSNADSLRPSISAHGRYVAFVSEASNLGLRDTPDHSDVFVRDRLLGVTRQISVGPAGYPGHNGSVSTAISSTGGQFVAFGSLASNLVADDTNGLEDIFLRDRLASR